MKSTKWTNESWTIKWKDEDHIEITGPHKQKCIMSCGDFESMLSAISAAYSEGYKKES